MLDLSTLFTHEPILIKSTDKIAHAFLCRILSTASFQAFVNATRHRHGITPPNSLAEIQAALTQHPPEDLEPETYEFVTEYFQQDLDEDLDENLPAFRQHLAKLTDNQPASAQLPPAAEALAEMLQPALDILSQMLDPGIVAKALARHVVTDLLEIPATPEVSAGLVWPIPLLGETFVIAMATPMTDLDELVATFRATCRDVFDRPQRDRGPDNLTDIAWLDACSRIFRLRGLSAVDTDLELAALSFDLAPHRRPPAPEHSDQYDDATFREADRIRRSITNYHQWLERIIEDTPPPDTAEEADLET